MKKSYIIFCLSLFAQLSFGQLNMSQLSNLNYQTLHNAELNDVWGYVDGLGSEFAIVGTTEGTSIVNVTNPVSPMEVFWLPGMNSVWRDIKTFGNYAYVTTEAPEGLTIIDLANISTSSTLPVAYYHGSPGSTWYSAHNLYIDSSGYAYIFGSNRGNGGVIILDIHTNPMAPIEVGVFDNWYAHDGFVQNDTLFGANVYEGIFSIVDISDKSNPILLGTKETANSFAHNVWVSNSGQFAFTTDEVAGAFLGAYDVSDPANIVENDRIQSNPGSGVIPHNTHVLNDFIITSYYRDGVTIHDVSHPNNLVEVGNFDTSPLSGPGFNGCWGVYPFLPSGNILATDIELGLHVLGVTYQKGCYLEGVVSDSVTHLPLADVTVEITNEIQKDFSKFNGKYAVGTINTGIQTVKFSKIGYETKTLSLNFNTGVVLTENIELVPLPVYGLTVIVRDANTNLPIENAQIKIEYTEQNYAGNTNALGEEDFSIYYSANHTVYVGKWGYKTKCEVLYLDNNTGVIQVQLEEGIYDDFTFDFGWQTYGNATEGQWVRDIPIGYPSTSNAKEDAGFDCGKFAYVTGNEDVFGENDDDVDNGYVSLRSPIFNLMGYADPYVNFATYFYNYHGSFPADDKLEIFLNNGMDQVLVDETIGDSLNAKTWLTKSIRVQDFLAPTATMRLVVKASDLEPVENTIEAGFDYFFVSNGSVLETKEISELESELVVSPNPCFNTLNVHSANSKEEILILDGLGNVVKKIVPTKNYEEIDVQFLESGLYFVQQGNRNKKFIKK